MFEKSIAAFESYWWVLPRSGMHWDEPLAGLEAWVHDFGHAITLPFDFSSVGRGEDFGLVLGSHIRQLGHPEQDQNEEDAVAIERLVFQRLGVRYEAEHLIEYANAGMWFYTITLESLERRMLDPVLLEHAKTITQWIDHPHDFLTRL